jgi:hypothetical protein
MAPVAPLAFAQLVLMFVALPVCLYRAPGWPFLVFLILAYLNAIAMLVLLVVRLRNAAIPARPLIGLGFGWLACLPLSVNCLRAAGLSFALAPDARGAMRFLSGESLEEAREDLAAQVDEALHEMEESDERHRRLAELRRQLAAEGPSGRA